MQTLIYPQLPTAAELAVTTGYFDGVHRGHCAVIQRLVEMAKRRQLPVAAVTYDAHPRVVLKRDNRLQFLTTTAEKEQLLSQQGVDYLLILPFTPSFAKLTAAQFMRYYLKERLSASLFVTGYNQRIGSDGVNNPDVLQSIGRSIGIDTMQAAAVSNCFEEISSTAIRRLLGEGRVEQANSMLGYEYFISGKVVGGMRNGRTIGFPTANIDAASEKLIPLNGAYAIRAEVGGRCFRGMLNIGCNPTFNDYAERTIEAHLFDFTDDIYGQMLTVRIVERLRPETRFTSPQELQNALHRDKQRAIAILTATDRV